jgi:hypothetical protein
MSEVIGAILKISVELLPKVFDKYPRKKKFEEEKQK